MVRSSNGMKSSMNTVGSAMRSGKPTPGRSLLPRIPASQNSFLVSRQRSGLNAFVERVGVDLGYVNGEPFFQFRAGQDSAAFRIIVALLYHIGEGGSFEPACPS